MMVFMPIDSILIREARLFITGANVHAVKTWILHYEYASDGSERQANFEKRLREFVVDQRKIQRARLHSQTALERAEQALVNSKALNRMIDEYSDNLPQDVRSLPKAS